MTTDNTMSMWDRRFFSMAKAVAGWSKDPSTQVGSVIVDNEKRVLTLGYNGFPRGIEDRPEDYKDRELKYKMVVHAEENAILNSNVTSLNNATLYVTPLAPCSNCVSRILQVGITTVNILLNDEAAKGRDHSLSYEMLDTAGITYNIYKDEVDYDDN